MKTKDFACHLIALVLALLATTELAMGAVKGKLNPVRAGINTRTTYSLIPSTSSKNRPAAFCLAGADCRISADAQGNTVVTVKNESGNFEPVEFVDEYNQPISVDWSNIMIFVGDGFFIDEYEGTRDNNGEPNAEATVENHGKCYIGNDPQNPGTCTITMTGGCIYGIRAGGYAETTRADYGCVYGNVNVNISGGEIYEISSKGSTFTSFPQFGAHGVLHGDFNVCWTGGTYTNTIAPNLNDNYIEIAAPNTTTGNTDQKETNTTSIVCGVKFIFDTAVPQNTDINEANYIKSTGSFLQDYKNKVCTSAGNVIVNTTLNTAYIINQGTLNNQGTIIVDGCPDCIENTGDLEGKAITFSKEHTKKQIQPCDGSTSNNLVDYCIYCGNTETGSPAHDFTNKVTMDDRKKEGATCSHGSIYYLTCKDCRIAANSERFTFEADDKLPHNFKINSITPDDGYPEAGVVDITCEGCKENLSFAFNAYTRVARTSTNPINIWAIAEPANDGSRVEPTCQPGSEMYRLSISNGTPLADGEADNGAKLKTVIGRYQAVLPAVPNKHTWENGVCTKCGEVLMVESYTTQNHPIYGPNQEVLLTEEEYTPVLLKPADFKAKLLEEIEKAEGRRGFTIYQDTEIDEELVCNDTKASQLTFDLKGHKLKVPGIRTKLMSNLTVKTGQLVTKYIQKEGNTCAINVARGNGASLLFDLEDDGNAYIQDSEVETESGNGIDAKFTRNYSYTLTDKWQALYLPFPVTLTNEMLADCDYALVETSKAGTSKSEAIYITKQATGTTLAANTPYLIRPKAAGDRVINVQDVKISKAESKGFDCSTRSGSDDATLEFKGTYEPINELKTKGYLFMNTNGNISGAKDNTSTLKPYRWYAQVKSGSLAKVSIFTIGEDDEEDGIQWIEEVEAGTNNNAPTYDLSGRRVGENRRPGLYIRGGKKVVRQ